VRGGLSDRTGRLRVTVVLADGSPLPAKDSKLPVDVGKTPQRFKVRVEAVRVDGTADPRFTGFVRLSAHPAGVIRSVLGAAALGRNTFVTAGQGQENLVEVSGAFGDVRIWAEDVGYVPADPADPAKPPACADGRDNNGNGWIDFPMEPGCAFANDDTEDEGSYATGVSAPIYFALPTIADVRGRGEVGKTPFEAQQVVVDTAAPSEVIVTRVSPDGFFVQDISGRNGCTSSVPGVVGCTALFAYNYNVPWGMQVCDRLLYLTGTVDEWFGATQLSFPSYRVHQWRMPTPTDPGDGDCRVPEPVLVTETMLPWDSSATGPILEPFESALVRVQGVRIAKAFGPNKAVNNSFQDNQSNCDLNDDGKLDFTTGSQEAGCADACVKVPECSEWNGYVSRGNFRLVVGTSILGIQANASKVPGFDPWRRRGQGIIALTGSLRNFSGGDLNWTIEARCEDDLVFCDPADAACLQSPPSPKSSKSSCIVRRTEYDPDEETN
jgi:hypothetical protein